MALTNLKIRGARPNPKPYHLTDGNGLFLAIQPNGSKLWRWKYRFKGKFRLMALKSYPEVSLANARAAHAEARSKLLKGTDPMAERKAEKGAATLANQTVVTGEAVNSFRKVASLCFLHRCKARGMFFAKT